RRIQVEHRSDRHDPVRVDGRVAPEVVVADVVHVHRVGHAGHLVNVAQQAGEVGVVGDALAVALEVGGVHRIEPEQCGPQAQVGLGQGVADQVAVFAQPPLKGFKGVEQGGDGVVVGVLGGGEAGLVHAVVDVVVDGGVDRVD